MGVTRIREAKIRVQCQDPALVPDPILFLDSPGQSRLL